MAGTVTVVKKITDEMLGKVATLTLSQWMAQYYFSFYMDFWISLRVSRLILQILKLTTM